MNKNELEQLINIRTHQQDHLKPPTKISEIFTQQSSNMNEKTPDTCRQTTAIGGPISATLIHNNSVSSNSAGINYYYPRNTSQSQTSLYSPAPFTTNIQHIGQSPMNISPPKIVKAAEHVTLSNTGDFFVKPATIDWNNVLKNLDLFYRERLVKLTQTIGQLRANSNEDEIIKTMLENKETIPYADQRLTEIIKEGVDID